MSQLYITRMSSQATFYPSPSTSYPPPPPTPFSPLFISPSPHSWPSSFWPPCLPVTSSSMLQSYQHKAPVSSSRSQTLPISWYNGSLSGGSPHNEISVLEGDSGRERQSPPPLSDQGIKPERKPHIVSKIDWADPILLMRFFFAGCEFLLGAHDDADSTGRESTCLIWYQSEITGELTHKVNA